MFSSSGGEVNWDTERVRRAEILGLGRPIREDRLVEVEDSAYISKYTASGLHGLGDGVGITEGPLQMLDEQLPCADCQRAGAYRREGYYLQQQQSHDHHSLKS